MLYAQCVHSFNRFLQVPNYSLLEHFREYGLRHVIQDRGGVESTAQLLGVESIPGRWYQAILHKEVIQLQRDGNLDATLVGALVETQLCV